MILYTVGYEGTQIGGFLEELRATGVETVVDVREMPLSRKRGFSKRKLSESLSAAGIGYVHLRSLGCPKPVRDQYRKSGNWSDYRKSFLAHLATQGDALSSAIELARSSKCALLCFEANWEQCHRSLISGAMVRRGGLSVSHLNLVTDQKAKAGLAMAA